MKAAGRDPCNTGQLNLQGNVQSKTEMAQGQNHQVFTAPKCGLPGSKSHQPQPQTIQPTGSGVTHRTLTGPKRVPPTGIFLRYQQSKTQSKSPYEAMITPVPRVSKLLSYKNTRTVKFTSPKVTGPSDIIPKIDGMPGGNLPVKIQTPKKMTLNLPVYRQYGFKPISTRPSGSSVSSGAVSSYVTMPSCIGTGTREDQKKPAQELKRYLNLSKVELPQTIPSFSGLSLSEGASHIESMLVALGACEHFKNTVSTMANAKTSPVFITMDEVFLFSDRNASAHPYFSFLLGALSNIIGDAIPNLLNGGLKQMSPFLESLGLTTEVLNQSGVASEFLQIILSKMYNETSMSDSLVKQLPFLITSADGHECSGCGRISLNKQRTISFLISIDVFGRPIVDQIKDFFVSENLTFVDTETKCCSKKDIGQREKRHIRANKMLCVVVDNEEIQSSTSQGSAQVLDIPKEILLRDGFWDLKSCVLKVNNKHISIVKKGSEWFIVNGIKIAKIIDLDYFLNGNIDMRICFYEKVSIF